MVWLWLLFNIIGLYCYNVVTSNVNFLFQTLSDMFSSLLPPPPSPAFFAETPHTSKSYSKVAVLATIADDDQPAVFSFSASTVMAAKRRGKSAIDLLMGNLSGFLRLL